MKSQGSTKNTCECGGDRSDCLCQVRRVYTAAELATIAREVEHEDEIDRLREADEWESDYAADPSGQS